jgi:hypothetical protein
LKKYNYKYDYKTKSKILLEVTNNKNNLYIIFWSLYMIW